ncbi:MAG: ribosomal protein S18 acetylase RimI-like enzyme [Kiritimatiellia bacterium]|jgi:ribosomal protein S18 acetylase RimI-like enzyme
MQLTRLQPQDADRLRAIRLRALGGSPHAFCSTLAETEARPPESWVQQLLELETYVVCVDGEDVGMVRGMVVHDPPGAAMLMSMWVAPSMRGLGVADLLVDAVERWALARDCATIVLDVAGDNARAISFYTRRGFVRTGDSAPMRPPKQHLLEHRLAMTIE